MSQEDAAVLADRKAVADGILEFSVDLLKILHQENKNLIFSPLSISAALSLVYLGAAGNTHEEIGKLLRSPTGNHELTEKYHQTMSNIMESVIENDDGNRFRGIVVTLANGIFMQEHLDVKPSYLTEATALYKSEVSNVDFNQNGQATVKKINGWVSEKTKGRISQLFSEPLSTDTLIVLVNTLYFLSSWWDRFYEGTTSEEKFFTGKEEITVPMMRNEKGILYMDNKSLQFEAIALKYTGQGYEMRIILPYANQSLQNLVNNLQLNDLQDILAGGQDFKVAYKIPRFKFSSSLSLKDTLSKLGMRDAFSKANLSNMIEASARLDDVTHAAEIEVDEKGTKASAVTGARVVQMCLRIDKRQSIQFYVNRPFMALVCHQPTSTILFSATVYQPTISSVPS